MIREIKWHNHKILGNLELNFTKPDGTPYNTIVLAGRKRSRENHYTRDLSYISILRPWNHLNISSISLMVFPLYYFPTRVVVKVRNGCTTTKEITK